jgi:DNA (cytosine-5)-methyltransferase 1
VAENVPGIVKLAEGDVCESLERLGYSVGIWMYEAAAVGAWHRRMRVFFVAHSESGRSESWGHQRNRDYEALGEWSIDQAPGSGEPSGFVPHARRRMFERGAVEGAFRGKREKWVPADLERPDSAPVPYSEGNGRREGIEIAGGSEEGTYTGAWSGFGLQCSDFSDSDMQRREEQQPSVAEDGERPTFGSIECSGGRLPEPGLGGVAYGLPHWLDSEYWRVEPDISRVAKGVKNRVARLRALGNAVVPAQAYPIFRAIAEIEKIQR